MAPTKSRTEATQQEWEDLAHIDPLWAILSDDTKQFGRWNREEFFISGQREIDALMTSCGIQLRTSGRVLDFGCGIGRLSRAFLHYFHEVHGVDISEEMIRLAREQAPDCSFHLNRSDDLRLFPDDFFDFVYSNIVLQHQRTKAIARAYIREFIRVAKSGGTIVFQVPHKLNLRDAIQVRRRLYSLFKTLGVPANVLYNRFRLNPMRTIYLSSDDVEAVVSSAGGRLIRCEVDNFNRNSMSYVVTKVDRT